VLIDPLAGRTLGTLGSSFVIGSLDADPSPAGGPPELIAPLHLHRVDDEAWYVLSGKLGFQLDEDIVEVGSGGGVLVPRGTGTPSGTRAGAGALSDRDPASDRKGCGRGAQRGLAFAAASFRRALA
jgi:hypothetical protein